MPGVSMTVDTRPLARAMREYMKVTRRTETEAINTKAFYAARGATRHTEKANREQIEALLGVQGYNIRQVTRGKNAGKFRKVKGGMIVAKSSLAERILRARIHAKGEAQPTVDEMQQKVKRFIAARLRSVAFLKSGWIPAIKQLAPLAKDKSKAPKQDPSSRKWSPKQIGDARPAIEGFKPESIIRNFAVPKHGETGAEALERLGGEGLRRALDDEVRSIGEYIARKMQEASNRFNAR